jgi:hypothetical protein
MYVKRVSVSCSAKSLTRAKPSTQRTLSLSSSARSASFSLPQAAGRARPSVQIEQPERDALGGDGQGRMQIQAPTALVIQWAEVGDGLLGGVVQLGGVLDAQHPGMRPQARLGAGDVRGEHALGGDLRMVEQAVGGACFAPTSTGGRNTHRRFVSECGQDPARAPVQALIPEVNAVELRGQRTHALTPSAARKSAASG